MLALVHSNDFPMNNNSKSSLILFCIIPLERTWIIIKPESWLFQAIKMSTISINFFGCIVMHLISRVIWWHEKEIRYVFCKKHDRLRYFPLFCWKLVIRIMYLQLLKLAIKIGQEWVLVSGCFKYRRKGLFCLCNWDKRLYLDACGWSQVTTLQSIFSFLRV